jgi:regulator of sigma E protease
VSWLLAFIGFAALIIFHELGHFAAAKAVGMRVERFMLFFPPVAAKVRRGETEYGIGMIPLGGYVKITGMNPAEEIPPEHAHRAYYRQPVWKRIVVIAAGPAVNIVLAFAILFAVWAAVGVPKASSTIAATERNMPATGVLAPGDRIVSIDGVRGDVGALSQQVAKHTCSGRQVDRCQASTPARIAVVRGGRTLTLDLRPRYDAQLKRTRLGFAFDQYNDPLPIGQAATESVTGMWRVTKATVSAIGRIFYDSKARDDVSGVVGSYETTRQTFQQDNFIFAYQLLALISLSLAIVNLFPFLPLDGGHIFWALAEKVRGRPIPFRIMEQASYVGFVLVLMLFALGLTNDIDRLRGEGFGVR